MHGAPNIGRNKAYDVGRIIFEDDGVRYIWKSKLEKMKFKIRSGFDWFFFCEWLLCVRIAYLYL